MTSYVNQYEFTREPLGRVVSVCGPKALYVRACLHAMKTVFIASILNRPRWTARPAFGEGKWLVPYYAALTAARRVYPLDL